VAIVTSDDRGNRGTDHYVSIDRNKEQVRLWLAFEHGFGARHHATNKWLRLGGRWPIPITTAEALRRCSEFDPVSEIGVIRDGAYWRVADLRGPKPRLGDAA
jgi:hypothetical protein